MPETRGNHAPSKQGRAGAGGPQAGQGKQMRSPLLDPNRMHTSPPSAIINEEVLVTEESVVDIHDQTACSCCRRACSRKTRRLCFYTTLLVICASAERVSFKLSIDQMAPFRVFLGVVVVSFSLLLSSVMVCYKKVYTNEITKAMDRFPRRDIFFMALLDTVQLYMMIISAEPTPPVLTVIFLQATLPVIMVLSKVMQPKKLYTRGHWFGAVWIVAGVILALASSLTFSLQAGHLTAAINMVGYLGCCLPAAISQLYKERAIMRFAQPMDCHYLNFLLVIYQILMILILSPLAYRLQGFGTSWNMYADVDYGQGFTDLYLCFVTDVHIPDNKYPEKAACRYVTASVVMYVLSTSSVNFAVNGVLQKGSVLLMYRSLNLSVAVSCLALALYTASDPIWSALSLHTYDFVSLAFVLVGLDMYHRQPEPDTEVLTHWSPA